MIRVERVRWQNLLSTGNDWTEVDFTKSGTTLVVGENGAGKTTMIEALSFGWFNRPYRKITKPELINTITGKGLLVEIEHSSGGKKYLTRRGMKPNLFEVLEDGKKWDFGGVQEQQALFEKGVLKMTHKSFLHIVAIGTTNYTPFLKLPAGDRRKFVDDLLDTEVFTVMGSFLKTRLDALKKQSLEHERRGDVLSERLKNEEKRLREIVRVDSDQIEEKEELAEKHDSEAKEHDLVLDQIEAEVDSRMGQIRDAQKVRDKLSKLQKLRYPLEEKKRRTTHEKEFFERTEDCPTCGQELTHELRCESAGAKARELEEVDSGLKLLDEKIGECVKRIQEVSKIELEIEQMRDKSRSVRGEANLSRKLASALRSEIKSLRGRARASSDEAREALDRTRVELDGVRRELGELSQSMPVLSAAGQLLKDSGIKAAVVRQYVSVINKLVNKYLADLDFFVGFEFDENFEVSLRARHRDQLSYEGFSSGEKMRIDLALLFAWRAVAKMRVSTSVDLLIFDEVLDASLDKNGADDLLKVVSSLTSDNSTVIISHKGDQLADKFERVIRFDRVGNFSKSREAK